MSDYQTVNSDNIYKAIGRSILNYAASVWTSFLSATKWRKLKTMENKALMIANGCMRMTNIKHLHEETKVLRVRAHNTFFKLLHVQAVADTINGYEPFRFLGEHPRDTYNEERLQPRHASSILAQIDRGEAPH